MSPSAQSAVDSSLEGTATHHLSQPELPDVRLRLREVERQNVRHLDPRRDEPVRVPFPARALPNRIHVPRARPQVVVHDDPPTLRARQPRVARELVPRGDPDREHCERAGEDGAVRELEPRERAGGGVRDEPRRDGTAEETHPHVLDAPEDDLPALRVELAREGVGGAVDDRHVGNGGEVVYCFGCFETQEAPSQNDGLRWHVF